MNAPSVTVRVMLDDIIAVVTEHYGVPALELLAARKNAEAVRARHVAFWLACRMTDLGYSAIARKFRRDHSTISCAEKKVSQLRSVDSQLAAELDELMAACLAVARMRHLGLEMAPAIDIRAEARRIADDKTMRAATRASVQIIQQLAAALLRADAEIAALQAEADYGGA